MLTGELLRKLKGKVHYTLPKGHISPRERLLQLTRRIRILEGRRHENYEEAVALLSRYEIENNVSDFEKIVIVIRNPYDYIVSRFHYLMRDQKNNTGPAAKIAALGNFKKYALEAPRFYNIEGYVLNEQGNIPDNMIIVKYENMESELNEVLTPYLTSSIDFSKRYNTSAHKEYTSYIKDKEIEAAVYNKFRFLFDEGYYKRMLF